MNNDCMKWNAKLKIGVFCTIIEGVLSGFNFILLLIVMDMIQTGKGNMLALLQATGVLALIYLLRLLIYSKGYTNGQIGGAEVSKKIRLVLGDKIKKIPLSKFTKGQIGTYINTITSDVNNYEKILTHKIGDLTKNITMSAVLILIASYFYLPAGLILLFAELLLIPGLWLSFYMVKKYGNEKNAICAEAVSSIVEYITGIQTFRAYGVGGVKNRATTEAMKNFSNISYIYERKVLPIGTVLNILTGCSTPLVIWVASRAWINGTLNDLLFILLCLLPLLITKLSAAIFVDLTSYKNLMISKNKIKDILEELEETGSMDSFATNNHDIEFENVSFSYVKDEPVLTNINFIAKNQKLTAIVGDSGSGKSTILNLISKYYEPNNGTIYIGGKPINHIAAERVLEQISMVDQDVFLFNDTIRENIRHSRPSATDEEIELACKEANCDVFIQKMKKGYDTPIGENGNLISGGERQRLSIARAILKNSPILLLDEATASLDIENELAVKQAIANLLKQRKTVLMIAHTLSIVKNADQILVVSNGKIAESGTHEELLKKDGKYAAMWKAEQKLSA